MGEHGMSAISSLANLEWLMVGHAKLLTREVFVHTFANGRLCKLLFLNLSQHLKLSNAGLMAVAQNCPNLGTPNLCHCGKLTDISLSYVTTPASF
jgi:hypothetical protein